MRVSVFGTPKSPISDEAGEWIERSMQRFVEIFGTEAATTAAIVLPTPEFFPDEGETPPARVHAFFKRVCNYMKADTSRFELFLFENEIDDLNADLKKRMPSWRGNRAGARDTFSERSDDGHVVIGVEQKQLADPMCLIAALARETGHNIVLDRRLVEEGAPDMSSLADLMTVFWGLGIFTANAAFHFSQYAGGGRQGWSVSRRGSLSEEMYGYALACWARLRHERHPAWVKHLKPNVAHYFKQSTAYIAKRRP